MKAGFFTRWVSRPSAERLLPLTAVHRGRKLTATLISVTLAWLGSGAALILVNQGQFILAGAMSLLFWQSAYVFDCLDGQIARQYRSASAAGAGVDASADVLAMTGTVLAGVYGAATQIEADRPRMIVCGLLILGGVARTAGPLWTVADQLARSAIDSGVGPRGIDTPRMLSMLRQGVTHLGDYPLILLLTSVAIAWGGQLMWTIAAAACGVTGLLVSVMTLAACARDDQFR